MMSINGHQNNRLKILKYNCKSVNHTRINLNIQWKDSPITVIIMTNIRATDQAFFQRKIPTSCQIENEPKKNAINISTRRTDPSQRLIHYEIRRQVSIPRIGDREEYDGLTVFIESRSR